MHNNAIPITVTPATGGGIAGHLSAPPMIFSLSTSLRTRCVLTRAQ